MFYYYVLRIKYLKLVKSLSAAIEIYMILLIRILIALIDK